MADSRARIVLDATDKTAAAFASVERQFKGLQSSADSFQKVFAGLGGLLSAGAFVAFARNAISSAAALDDMAETTGATVEGLSKLTDIARIGGQDIAQVETALVRLTKALSGTDEESKGAGAAFKALGLSFEQLKTLSPDKALEEVARAFAKYQDNAGKTSTALAIFGKSGAQLLPLLKDIAQNLDRTSSLTGDQAAAAERLDKNLKALSVSTSNYARSLIADLVPALNKFFETAEKAGAGGALDATLGYALRKKLGIGDKNIQKEIREQQDKLDEMEETRAKSRNPFARATDTDVENLRNYITGLKEVARIEALASAGDPYSREGRLPVLPFIPSTEETKAKSKALKEALLDPWQRFGDQITGPDSPAALASENMDKLTESARRAREEFLGLIDPARGAYADLARFEELAPKMGLTADQVERVRDALREKIDLEEFGKPLKDFTDDTKDRFGELTDVINGWSKQATQAFVDFAFGAKTSVGDMLTSIAKQFAAMQLQKSVFDPLFGAAGELLKSVFKFHGGGIVGSEGAGSFGPALAWAGAPRFHGGMSPDEYPAILQRGEGVFTPGQMRALGSGGSVRVEIHNEGTPQQVVSAQPTFDARGVVIGIVTRDLATNGPIAQSMGNLMGARR